MVKGTCLELNFERTRFQSEDPVIGTVVVVCSVSYPELFRKSSESKRLLMKQATYSVTNQKKKSKQAVLYTVYSTT